MRLRWFLLRRTAWTVTAAWIFLTLTFLALSLSPDPNAIFRQFVIMRGSPSPSGDAQQAAVRAYLQSRGRTGTLWERYLRWLGRYATLNLGDSSVYGRSVNAVLVTRLPVTLGYLVPAIVVASGASVVSGIFGAIRKGSLSDRATNTVSHVGLAVPMFFAGLLVVRLLNLPAYNAGYGYFEPRNLLVLGIAAAVMGLNLYAVQAWAIRAEAIEIVPAEFVKTLRASGSGDVRVARHVLRNALAPVFALLVSELLVVLFVGVYVVELVFGLPGVAAASFQAFQERDFALIIATVVLPVILALLVKLGLDVTAAVLDPRVAEAGE